MVNPMRRLTLVVNDLDASLRFYRDILGMEIYFDKVLKGNVNPKLLGLDYEDSESRIVCLKSTETGDMITGAIGLLYYYEPEYKPREEINQRIGTSDIVLVFHTIDSRALYAKMIDEGIPIAMEPFDTDIQGIGKVRLFACKDPNGVVLEIGQSLD